VSLLRDFDLIANITAPAPAVPLIEGVELPANPYSKDSPVQSSSIDLRIGNIYLPGVKEKDLGGAQNPKSDHVLKTGETAVVTTKETLHLPGNIAALGYPPSRVSFKGLLMTNPGHVDPGYEGVMRFTVINMAKDPYSLERGREIVTLLLFSMDRSAQSDWHQRNPGGSSLPSQASISRLSRDFVDVEKRAKDQGLRVSAWFATGLALVAAFLSLVSSGHLFHNAEIEDLKKKQEIVEFDLKNRVDVERKLQDFDSRLKELQQAISEQKKAQNAGKTARNGSGQQP